MDTKIKLVTAAVALALATPANANESSILVQYGQAEIKLEGSLDATPFSGEASGYASVETVDMSSGYWSVSYNRKINDKHNLNLNVGRIDGDGFSRDEFSGSVSRNISENFDIALGLYFSDASLGSAAYNRGVLAGKVKGLQNTSVFLSLQRSFQLTSKLIGFGRVSYQTGESEFTGFSGTINSQPKPSGTSFAIGGIYPLENNRFISVTYEMKDIEYIPGVEGGDPEEDFSILSVGYGLSF